MTNPLTLTRLNFSLPPACAPAPILPLTDSKDTLYVIASIHFLRIQFHPLFIEKTTKNLENGHVN